MARVSIQPVTDEASHKLALERIQTLMATGDDRTELEDHELDLLGSAVEQWELNDWPSTPSPVHEVIAYHLEQKGMPASSLFDVLKGEDNARAILAGAKLPSARMLPQLARKLGIPFADLAASYEAAA